MSVKIRLMRMGKKKQPTYRVVVADARSPRDGRFIERIGTYAPRQDPSVIEIDGDRALDWLQKGAQPTEQVQKLLESSGVWDRFKAERPKADTVARRKVAAHKAAVAARPPEPQPEPEEAPAPEAAAEEPAAEPEPAAAAEAEAPAAAEEPAATAEPEEAPAAEEPAAEAPAAAAEEAEAEEGKTE